MKRLFVILVALSLFFSLSLSLTVFAASKTYTLPEPGLKLKIPSNYYVITRDTPEDDPIFDILDIAGFKALRELELNNTYLNAVSRSFDEEIVLTMSPVDLNDFNQLDDTTLDLLASTFSDRFAEEGVNVLSQEIEQHSHVKFIKIRIRDSKKTYYGLQFYTVHDGKLLVFTMRAYTRWFSSEQEDTLDAILDSIKFDKPPKFPAPAENTNPFLYTDPDSGATFTVPANWKQTDFLEEKEYLDVKFASTKENTTTIIFGSNDIWAQLPAYDKIGYSRSDLNQSTFTVSELAELFELEEEEFSIVTYNGLEYFKIDTDSSTDAYGLNISIKDIHVFHIHNGWLFAFHFTGPSNSAVFSDFESLLNSVQYPFSSDSSSTGSSESSSFSTEANSVKSDTPSNTDGSDTTYTTVLLWIVSILGAGAIVLAVLIRRKDRKKNTAPKFVPKPELSHSPASTTESNPPSPLICSKCRFALPADSVFCPYCGAKLEQENTDI